MTVNPAGIREEEAAVAIVFSFPLVCDKFISSPLHTILNAHNAVGMSSYSCRKHIFCFRILSGCSRNTEVLRRPITPAQQELELEHLTERPQLLSNMSSVDTNYIESSFDSLVESY